MSMVYKEIISVHNIGHMGEETLKKCIHRLLYTLVSV